MLEKIRMEKKLFFSIWHCFLCPILGLFLFSCDCNEIPDQINKQTNKSNKGERAYSGLQLQRYPVHMALKIAAVSEAMVAGTGG